MHCCRQGGQAGTGWGIPLACTRLVTTLKAYPALHIEREVMQVLARCRGQLSMANPRVTAALLQPQALAISDARHMQGTPSSHDGQLTLVNQKLLPLGAVEHLLSVLHGTNNSRLQITWRFSLGTHIRACPKALFVSLILLPLWVILSRHKVLQQALLIHACELQLTATRGSDKVVLH